MVVVKGTFWYILTHNGTFWIATMMRSHYAVLSLALVSSSEKV